MRRCRAAGIWIAAWAATLAALSAWAGVPAFPGAEGFGSETPHARGRPVLRVTRLDDVDKWQAPHYLEPGQFRYALAKAKELGGAYIVFDVSGTIRLKRDAKIPSNVYIAGQTSPGGIAFEGKALIVDNAHDVVIRHIRHRGAGRKGDAINIVNSYNVVIDHVSISFFRDGAVDIVNNSHDVTVQWSHMGDAMRSGSTNEPYHGEPNLLRDGVDRVTFHHNLYTHAHSRVPWAKKTCKPGMLLEFSNNVVYNFRKYPTQLDAPNGRANIIGNVYIPGRNTHGDPAPDRPRPVVTGSNNFSVFVKGNFALSGMGHDRKKARGPDAGIGVGPPAWVQGVRPDPVLPEWRVMGTGPGRLGPKRGVFNLLESRVQEIPAVTTQPAEEAFLQVLRCFGAMPRDNTDRRLVREVVTRTGAWKYEKPDDRNVYQGEAPRDSDGDGIPDWFEEQYGGDLSPNGHHLDPVYEDFEVYLNELALRILPPGCPR